jgi:hypothetical protein
MEKKSYQIKIARNIGDEDDIVHWEDFVIRSGNYIIYILYFYRR